MMPCHIADIKFCFIKEETIIVKIALTFLFAAAGTIYVIIFVS